ncbi:transporter substrate-binding domain-containing protein [Bradyrhizobium sp. BRP56]|uniref:substrate-binding periplasmic protein n=1 Tax=Bradyrhizobium sp. BRP56 TaxID=2793819 RepID=UPI001CD31A8E|nr:transporter substrate-binding domain-containing protein [Bradyrhizobium sp. BRP56]MCA1395944.1 transporter substrate-binding domain-containing protein [Bradyrhizobium sp. BRP56]
MRAWTAALAAALGFALISKLAGVTAARAADEPLRVCLDEDLPPFSVHHRGKPASGFDVALAQAITGRLGRKLEIQWFESKLDDTASPALEANALLSDGRCSLVGGYALTTDSLKAPGVTTAKLPDFDGATREDRRRRIPIGVLAPSQPYIYSPMTVVLGPKAKDKLKERKIKDIGDLAGLRLTIESGTLGDAILMTFDKGKLIDDITHLVPGRSDLLGELERGEFDATLLDLRRFDAYRAEHPDTRITASGYYYPIGANRGYVALETDKGLLESVNKVLADLQAKGTIAELGKAAGLTWLPPREPIILGDVWLKILNR